VKALVDEYCQPVVSVVKTGVDHGRKAMTVPTLSDCQRPWTQASMKALPSSEQRRTPTRPWLARTMFTEDLILNTSPPVVSESPVLVSKLSAKRPSPSTCRTEISFASATTSYNLTSRAGRVPGSTEAGSVEVVELVPSAPSTGVATLESVGEGPLFAGKVPHARELGTWRNKEATVCR